MVGYYDVFLPDGGPRRAFRPLWVRTYRFVQVDVTTAGEPLQLDDYTGTFTAYPFVQRATFRSPDATLGKIWDVGWRTARLCALETYMDCPYYEQLQYVGDTRIQALISLYVAGDDRLMRNAIEQFDDSRLPEGLTLSRYPSVSFNCTRASRCCGWPWCTTTTATGPIRRSPGSSCPASATCWSGSTAASTRRRACWATCPG
jgi:hypothetical protein